MEIIVKDYKRQVTAVLTGTMAGDFLPIQEYTKEKPVAACLPFNFHRTGTSHTALITGQMSKQ